MSFFLISISFPIFKSHLLFKCYFYLASSHFGGANGCRGFQSAKNETAIQKSLHPKKKQQLTKQLFDRETAAPESRN